MKGFIAHYHGYLSVNMDAEVVAQLMISQQLLSEDITMTAQSNYHKNSLILQQIRLMDVETLALFFGLLQRNFSQQNIGNALTNGMSEIVSVYVLCSSKVVRTLAWNQRTNFQLGHISVVLDFLCSKNTRAHFSAF